MQLLRLDNMCQDCFKINRIRTYNLKGRHEIMCISKLINSSHLYAPERPRGGMEINFSAQNRLSHK